MLDGENDTDRYGTRGYLSLLNAEARYGRAAEHLHQAGICEERAGAQAVGAAEQGRSYARLNNSAGWTGAASRLVDDPSQLGRLRGRDGMFASRSAQLNRANAISAVRSVSHRLTRIAEAEQRAERGYRASVEAQRTRDAIGVPRLSTSAAAALEAVLAAPYGRTRRHLVAVMHCVISRPWRAPGKPAGAIHPSRRRSTGFRRRRSSGSARRASGPHCAACGMAARSQCRASDPGSIRR